MKTPNTAIYSGPVDFATATSVANLSSYSGKQMRLVRQARVGNTISSQISVDGKVVGWVNNNALDIFYKSANESSASGYRMVKANSQNEGYYMLPVAEAADYYGNLKDLYNKVLTIDRQVTVDGVVWNRMKEGSKLVGWTKASNLGLTVSTNNVVWAYARVKTPNTTIYSAPVDFATSVSVGNLSTYSGKQMRLVREARVGSVVSSQISVDEKVIGWVTNGALDTFYKTAMEQSLSGNKIVKNTSGIYYMLPVPEPVDKRGVLSTLAGTTLMVDRKVTVDGAVWNRIKTSSGLLGWTLAANLRDPYWTIDYNKAVSLNARVTTTQGHTVWTEPYNTSSTSKIVGPASNYAGKTIKLVREVKTNNIIYYQFSLDGKVIGWIDKRALTIS